MQIVTLGAESLLFLVGWSCKSHYELSGHAWSIFSLDLFFFFHPGTSWYASLLLLSSTTLWSSFPSPLPSPTIPALCCRHHVPSFFFLFFSSPFHPSSVIKFGRLKDRRIKDENKDYELLFYFFSFGRFANTYRLDAAALLGQQHIHTCFCCHGDPQHKKPSAYQGEVPLQCVKQPAWETGHAPAVSW